jgi:uncharacterized SAM-dependent methyltransferase
MLKLDVDRKKTIELEQLVKQRISKYLSSVVQIKDGNVIHFELSLKFRTDQELNDAIAQLQLHR